MTLWLTWAFLAILATSLAQRIAQDDAETVLEAAAIIRENIFNRLRLEESNNASCILQGLRDRKLSVFQLHRLSKGQSFRHLSERLCGNQDQWVTDIHYIEEELSQDSLAQLTPRQQSVIETTCGSFPDYVALSLMRGDLAATKKLILGLLTQIRYPVATPDVITLFENVVKIIENSDVNVEPFRVTSTDLVENLLLGILSQNQMQPFENYQILELVSTLDNIRPVKELNLLQLIKTDSYPKDVIDARDKLIEGLGYGTLSGEPASGWPDPPQQLLSLLTALTANPNDNDYVPYAHVLFGYFRLRYLSMMGYEFVPRSLADIAFLLNSFLTVRHPILIREVYFEFAKIPWQQFVNGLDFSIYSEPRVMLFDMLHAIMDHPDGLKLCNKIIFHYFINGDECPSWLQILPKDSEPMRPIEVLPGVIPKPPPPLSKCPGEDTPVIQPECLIEIIDNNGHANFIIELIRYNPGTVERYPYNTREAVYKAILDDLKIEKFKDDEVNQFVIEQAIARLPLNDNKFLAPVYVNMCPNDISELNSHEPTLPPPEDSSHYKTGSLGTDESEECTEVPGCNKIPVIDQKSLIAIISESRTNAIKNIVLLKPVLYYDYKDLDTREQILKKVLVDREKELQDEIMHFVIPQAVARMKTSWEGTLPPVVEEICEEDLKYNIVLPENEDDDSPDADDDNSEYPTCSDEKTIDPFSLIDILSDKKTTKSVQRLVLEEPILASEYGQYSTRPGVLKAVVIIRSEAKGQWQLTYDVRKIFKNVPFNWKQTLPLEYLDDCTPKTTPIPESDFSPSDLFNNTIPGLGEKPVPCDSTTPMPEDNDVTNSNEEDVTETLPVTNAPTPKWPYNSPTTPITPSVGVGSSDDSPNNPGGSSPETPDDTDDLEDCDDDASAIGAGVGEIGAGSNENAPTLGDQVLDSILGMVSLNPKKPKKKCKPKPLPNLQCNRGEVMTDIVKIESLWDALTPDSPSAPYIRNKVKAFVVPIDQNKDYTKAEVLKDILLSIRDEVRDTRVLQNLDLLIKCIRFDGPGVQAPAVETVCLQNSLLSPPPTESLNPMCKSGEVMVTVVQTNSLYSALSPSVPKTPYIRNRVNGYIVPVDTTKMYTKAEVLRDILLSLKEEMTDVRISHNVDVLIGYIRNDGPALDEPDVMDICIDESSIDDNPSGHLPSTGTTGHHPTKRPGLSTPSQPTDDTGNHDTTGHRPTKRPDWETPSDDDTTNYPDTTGHRPTKRPDWWTSQPTDDTTNYPDTTGHRPTKRPHWGTPSQPGDDTNNYPDTTGHHPTKRPDWWTSQPGDDTTNYPDTTGHHPTKRPHWGTPSQPGDDTNDYPDTTGHHPTKRPGWWTPSQPSGDTPDNNWGGDVTTQSSEDSIPSNSDEITRSPLDDTSSGEPGNPNNGNNPPGSTYPGGHHGQPSEEQDTPSTPSDGTPPGGESKPCPCEYGTVLMKIIDNHSVTNMLADDHLPNRLNKLIVPASKYVGKSRRQVLEALLTELMLRDHEVYAAMISCMDDGSDSPSYVYACVPTQYAYEFPPDVYVCPSNDYNDEDVFTNRQTQCPCPKGQQYFQVVNNINLMDMLSPADAHLRARIATLVLPVAKYANTNKKGMLENALREVMLRDYENAGVLSRCSDGYDNSVQIMTSCVASEYADLFPMDVVSCPETTTRVAPPSNCHRPIDVLVPSSLLESVYPDALKQASDMVDIIMNSSLERAKYERFGCRAKIILELLREMKEIAVAKLQVMETERQGDIERVKMWIRQLEILTGGIRYEGIGNEPPLVINTCVLRPVDCNALMCETTPAPGIEEHTMLQDALMQAAQNVGPTTPSPTGKRKIKKTHIIYTTKETINVNIQATKQSNDASPADDISKITDIMQAEDKQSEGEPCTSTLLQWPLLLKPLDEECWDNRKKIMTHPVQMVNITQLLQNAEGSIGQIYVASARLAGLETYHMLRTFDMTEEKTKADFFDALVAHLGIELPIKQHCTMPVILTTFCDYDLYQALPVQRAKRNVDDALERLQKAVRRGNELLLQNEIEKEQQPA